MQIVIDIPDYDYRHIKEYYENNDIVETTYSYIYHGTPLPEGHGRLIDADAIVMPFLETENDEKWMRVAINSAPTIIEADVHDTDVGNNDRNCEACKHHHDGGCDSWECEEVEG